MAEYDSSVDPNKLHGCQPMSQIRHIHCQTNKKAKVINLRMISSDNYGWTDPIESPD